MKKYECWIAVIPVATPSVVDAIRDFATVEDAVAEMRDRYGLSESEADELGRRGRIETVAGLLVELHYHYGER